MSDLPEIRPGGSLPMGRGRKLNGYGKPFDIDWITTRLIEAQILGIDTPVTTRKNP